MPLSQDKGNHFYAFVIPLVIVMLFSLVLILAVLGMVFWSRTTVIEHQSSESINTYPVVEPPPMPELPPLPEMPSLPAMPELPEASVPAEAFERAVPN
jgi:hypothetical protein